MLLSTTLGLFLGFWSLLYLVDFYLRARAFRLYLSFVERTGLVVTPFQVKWYTGRFQVIIRNWDFLRYPRMRRFLDAWFGVGVLAAGVSMIVMLGFLTKILYLELHWLMAVHPALSAGLSTQPSGAPATLHESAESQPTGLIPIVPGVNVPWTQLPLFLVVLVLAGVWHELGHAVAAVNEDVGVTGFGVFLLIIYPGAFTEIENEGLGQVSAWRQLKIYCAGIWHNFVLAALGVAFLHSLPTLLAPAYLQNKGVLVTEVSGESGLAGSAGLRPGHVVYGINYCKVFNEDSWLSCLARLTKTHYGYCVPRKEVSTNRAERVLNVFGELHCCGANSTQTHLCFYYKTNEAASTLLQSKELLPKHSEPKEGKKKRSKKAERLEALESSFNSSSSANRLENIFEYSCLPARYVTDHYVCNNSLPCHARTTCIYPALFNSTKLLRFFVANMSKPVLFIGFPSEVARHLSVSSFVPTAPWVPATLPVLLQLCAKYLITFSLALALLNAVPCHSLDGQFILAALLTGRRGRIGLPSKAASAYRGILLYGTLLLGANVGLALYKFARPWLRRGSS